MEVLIGFEGFNVSHTGLNLVQIVRIVLQKHNLTHRLLAITANNASDNGTLKSSLESELQSWSIS